MLVVGGAGYIGSHICKMLNKNGYVPIVIDRNLKDKPAKFGPSFDVDIPTNIQALDAIIKRFNVESCIHLAGSSSFGTAKNDPGLFYKNNVITTLVLLDKLIENNVKTFVFSSTASVYGDIGIDKCVEDSLTLPINAYGSSKLTVENMCKDYSKAHGMNCVSLRYFNVAGIDTEAEIGELGQKTTHIIPLLIDASHKNKTFNVFGNKYPTPDGTCVRDYVHVNDVAQATLKALSYCRDNAGYDVFNIGSGVPTSNTELIEAVQKHVGNINIEIKDARYNDLPYSLADISRAKEKLQWIPTQSTIDNVVGSAVQWYNKTHKKEIQ